MFSFVCILARVCHFLCADISHSNRHDVIALCGFLCIPQIASNIEHGFVGCLYFFLWSLSFACFLTGNWLTFFSWVFKHFYLFIWHAEWQRWGKKEGEDLYFWKLVPQVDAKAGSGLFWARKSEIPYLSLSWVTRVQGHEASFAVFPGALPGCWIRIGVAGTQTYNLICHCRM